MVSNFFYPQSSGSGIFCRELSKRLADEGFEVTVLTSQIPKSAPQFEEFEGYKIMRLKTLGTGWGISALCIPIPFLWNNHADYDLIHLHSYLFLLSNQTALMKKIRKFPMILHLHGGLTIPDSIWVGKFKPWFKKYLYDPTIGRFTVRSADKVLSVSKKDIALSKAKFGVEPEWVPAGVDTNIFRSQKKERGKIAFVGKLEKWKGAEKIPEIVKGLSRHDIKLHIIGAGSLLEKLRRKTKDLPVIFHGQVTHENIPEIIGSSEILIQPSLLEGLPLTCLESLACETPVVASDVGGVSEIIIDGKTGFLVSPNDTDQFIQSVIRLLENNRLREELGKKGRELIKRDYDWGNIVEKTIKIYKSIF
jgi:glycosyltransferase involved in cell wall biosynthesis